jgi:hypothetical protein
MSKTRKHFKVFAQIVASITDHWARGQAVNQACLRLGQAYPDFDAPTFRWMVLEAEKNA